MNNPSTYFCPTCKWRTSGIPDTDPKSDNRYCPVCNLQLASKPKITAYCPNEHSIKFFTDSSKKPKEIKMKNTSKLYTNVLGELIKMASHEFAMLRACHANLPLRIVSRTKPKELLSNIVLFTRSLAAMQQALKRSQIELKEFTSHLPKTDGKLLHQDAPVVIKLSETAYWEMYPEVQLVVETVSAIKHGTASTVLDEISFNIKGIQLLLASYETWIAELQEKQKGAHFAKILEKVHHFDRPRDVYMNETGCRYPSLPILELIEICWNEVFEKHQALVCSLAMFDATNDGAA